MKPARILMVFCGWAVFSLASAHAQVVYVWTGAGSNNDVSTAANWQGGVAPTGSGTEDLVFSAAGGFDPAFNSAFTVRDLMFSVPGGGYNLTGSGALTLAGDITIDPGYAQAPLIGVNLTLAAGLHNVSLGSLETGTDLYLFSAISGAGGVVKYGRGALVFDHSAGNTFSGPVQIEEGEVRVHGDNTLGTGLVSMNGGDLYSIDYYSDNHLSVLPNNFSLSHGVTFGDENNPYNALGSLTITGTTTAQGGLTNSAVDLAVYGRGLLTFGNVGETDAGTNFEVTGGGNVRIAGAASYTGYTHVYDDTRVVFTNGAPAGGGVLWSEDSSYIGSELTTNLQAGFIDHFDKSNTNGFLGFDSPDSSTPQHFAGTIDLTGFDSNARLGTSTAAILDGDITPQGTTYQFGGRGVLTVTSALVDSAGSRNVEASDGIQLYLSGNNAYTGSTVARLGGAIVFDSATAIPSSAQPLVVYGSGYIGATENTGLTAAQFLSKFDAFSSDGVIGFDAANPMVGRTVSDAIDMSSFGSGAYLGTSTVATLTGPITPANSTYEFAAFRNGQLTVNSTLSGTGNSVTIGLDGETIYTNAPAGVVYNPSVTLNGANTYDGGTTLLSGQLLLGNNSALGTGPLSVNFFGPSPAPTLGVSVAGLNIPNDIALSDIYLMNFSADYDYTLSGAISGDSGSLHKLGTGTLTLSGDNSDLEDQIAIVSGKIIFATNSAAGIGELHLQNFDGINDAQAIFTSNAPSIGSLSGDSDTTVDLGSGTLTIQQSLDATYAGHVIGTGGISYDGTGGTLTLTNANTYSGGTVLNAGTIVAGNDQALGPGAVTLNGGRLSVDAGVTLNNAVSFSTGGGILGGNGAFGSAVTIGGQGHLAPGNSVGLLTFNSGITWAPSGSFDVEVQGASGARGTGYDSINVTGGLAFTATLGAPFKINLLSLDANGDGGNVADFDSSMGYAWLVAHTDGLSGFDPANVSIDTSNFTNSLGTGAFNVSAVGNDIFVNFSPVPEPSTYALLALGGGVLLLLPRRRRA